MFSNLFKKTKRIVSMLLAISMIMGIMPMMAFAADPDPYNRVFVEIIDGEKETYEPGDKFQVAVNVEKIKTGAGLLVGYLTFDESRLEIVNPEPIDEDDPMTSDVISEDATQFYQKVSETDTSVRENKIAFWYEKSTGLKDVTLGYVTFTVKDDAPGGNTDLVFENIKLSKFNQSQDYECQLEGLTVKIAGEEPVESGDVVEPSGDEPIEEPSGDEPIEEPSGEPVVEPSGDEPVEEPSGEPVVEPSGDEPVEEPSGEPVVEPSGDEPVVEPSGDEPVVEPSGDEPVVEPSGDEPVVEPSGDEPVELDPYNSLTVEIVDGAKDTYVPGDKFQVAVNVEKIKTGAGLLVGYLTFDDSRLEIVNPEPIDEDDPMSSDIISEDATQFYQRVSETDTSVRENKIAFWYEKSTGLKDVTLGFVTFTVKSDAPAGDADLTFENIKLSKFNQSQDYDCLTEGLTVVIDEEVVEPSGDEPVESGDEPIVEPSGDVSGEQSGDVPVEPAIYRVTFNANGHGVVPIEYLDIPSGETIWQNIVDFDEVAIPDVEGFQFIDYSLDPNGDASDFFDFDTPITEDIELYAIWYEVPVESGDESGDEPIVEPSGDESGEVVEGFTLTLDPNNGEDIDIIHIDTADDIMISSPEDWGFTVPADKEFAGWLIDGEIYNEGDYFTLDHNTTAEAQWDDVVVEPSGDESGDEPIVEPSGDESGEEPIVEPSGDESGDEPIVEPSGDESGEQSGDTPVEPEVFRVTFDANGHGTVPIEYLDIPSGDTIWNHIKDFDDVRIADVDGYTFVDYSLDQNGTLDDYFDFDNPITGNITLYAIWVEVPVESGDESGDEPIVEPSGDESGEVVEGFTLTLDPNNGEDLDRIHIDTADDIMISSPEDWGFTVPADKEFAGWLIDGEIYNEGDYFALDHNTTAVAQWDDVVVEPSGDESGDEPIIEPSGDESGEEPIEPSGEEPVEPSGEEPVEPSGEEPVEPSGEEPVEPSGEEPIEPSGEEPVEPSGEEPIEPSGEEPVEPSGEEPVEPSGEEPVEPSGEEPVEPSGEEPVEPSGEEPVEPSGEEPVEPSGEEPVEPSGEEPVEPSGEESGESGKIDPKPASHSGGGGSGTTSYKITTKPGENGKITPENPSVKKNDEQEFKFIPDDGYMIEDVLVDGKSVGKVSTYTLEKVRAKHTIEVKFTEAPWSDVSDWAVGELSEAASKGLIPSSLDGKDLSKTVNRTEFAAIAVKMYEAMTGETAVPASVNPFEDTDDVEVLKAYALGITVGTSDTTFTPDREITRQELATMLTRACKKAGVDVTIDLSSVTTFSDDAQIDDWAKPSVYFMASKDIVKGVGESRFGVLNNATREQSLAMSLRCVNAFKK